MNVRYENYCSVATPRGIGRVVDIDYMSSPVIKYIIAYDDSETRVYTEQQIHLIMPPEVLDRNGKLLASESITATDGSIHFLFTYEYNHQIWFYSYFIDIIDRHGVKHIKQLNMIKDLGESE